MTIGPHVARTVPGTNRRCCAIAADQINAFLRGEERPNSLVLLRHKAGMLTRHYKYLYDRTDGNICGLPTWSASPRWKPSSTGRKRSPSG